MQIDLLTFIAQVVNFIILVALLRVFLYKPVIRAMAKREAKITARFDEADERESTAQQQIDEYETKMDEIEHDRDSILEEARKEARKKRDELIEKARAEADEKRESWAEAVDEQKTSFLGDVRSLTVDHLVTSIRHILHDLANTELESHIGHGFVKRVSELPDEELSRLPDSLTVRSSFELDEDAKTRIETALSQDDDRTIDFDTDSDMSLGIQLESENFRVAWTVDSYLDSLREEVEQRMQEEADRAS